ncbi:unnamed protein product [Camellia sinensis]
MGRGGKVGNKQLGKRRIGSKDKGSDKSESDDDYTVGADEEFEDSEEYCSSLAREESEESLDEFQKEEEKEDAEEEVRVVGRSRWRKSFPGAKKNVVGKERKKRRVVSYKEENDEDYEVEDDDDDEFMPDEIDLGDDEDELAVEKKNKKVGRPRLQEKGFVKGRKRKRSSKVMKKPLRKKPTKSRGKLAASNDVAFIKNPVVKERNKKISGTRERRFMEDSDSDFVSSVSSDFGYTMSEEEKEHVREASQFCLNLTTSLRSSSSQKILQEEGVLCRQRKSLGRKGKDKVEDMKNEAGKQVCGICLSEQGKKTVQGTLNCCSHYFCFACVMEWSKVESRCPLCKQRFVTISKPANSNTEFDLRTMVVQVPERDQVYRPSEEEFRGYLDPYENVICIECREGGHDALMLLCDLCDSPAHTYCVGLGCEVPEGNWYCEGCRPTALGSANPQAPNPMPVQRTINDLSGRSFPNENVREAIDLNTIPETTLPQVLPRVFSSPRRPGGDFQAASPVSGAGVGVLTVSERHRIQYQINHLLGNRVSQFGGRTNGMSATTWGNNILESQMERGGDVSFQPAIMQQILASRQHTFFQGRLQDDFTTSFQSRDIFSARSRHSRGQVIQDQTPTSAAGPGAIGVGINSRLGYEQLHPCSSRSSISDTNMAPYRYREGTILSRTLQGTLHTILALRGLEHTGEEKYES